jgi:UDP-N-acetyl-D-glucosamine dehydrogenase
LSYVVATARSIATHLRADQLVVLESTTYPTTTRDVVKPILESTGLLADRDFFLAFSPEREDPGNPQFTTERITKVVGGLGEASLRLACALYESFVVKTIAVSSAETAEAVKLTENIFRAVNIALVNELKIIYSAMGIDIWEVIEAAKTKPFGFMPFYPGPGLGGHCIPIDPFYLTWKAREYGIATRFIELAGQVNRAMPDHVVAELALNLDRRHRLGLNGSKILLIGMAYKKNVDDLRESPALKLMEILESRGVDPHIATIPMTREYASFAGRRSVAWDLDQLGRFDAVLIATDHDDVDYLGLAKAAKLIIDTRNVCGRAGIVADHIVKA